MRLHRLFQVGAEVAVLDVEHFVCNFGRDCPTQGDRINRAQSPGLRVEDMRFKVRGYYRPTRDNGKSQTKLNGD